MPLPPLEELKQLQEEITPGPWTVEFEEVPEFTLIDGEAVEVEAVRAFLVGATSEPLDFRYKHDAAKIAALAPPLLAEVIRLREALAHYVSGLEAAGDEDTMRYPPEERRVFRAVAKTLTRILEDK